METVEIPNHPFYIGVQFHPEFKSRPNRAHPLFKAFVAACSEKEPEQQCRLNKNYDNLEQSYLFSTIATQGA